MTAPTVTDEVLTHPDVVALRKTAQAAVEDWIEQIARTSIDETVGPPDNLPTEFVNEWYERLVEIAWTLERAEQEMFYATYEPYGEWCDLNRAAAQRGRAA